MSDHVLILLIPALPLLAAGAIGALGPRVIRGQSHWVAIALTAGSLAAASALLFGGAAGGEGIRGTLYTWLAVGQFTPAVSYRYDPLAAIMLFTVTLVSLIVMVYSRSYMRGDPGYARFFALVSLFVFAMTTLVLADNLLLLFFGWETVGLCSYLLIGHYYPRPAAAAAAKKAFIVNRVGDFGFLLGILLLAGRFGTLDFADVLDPGFLAPAAGERTLQIISWLLLAGAVGKSGQLLLHVWLPDAMEGPSPVSALIHAATMVTAGVYLLARTSPLFDLAGMLPAVATLGAATALFGAVAAVAQHDIKRALAYSTISQLGYMFLAVGAGVGGSAIFHLFTHAFFKALLFLGAGAVMHALGGELDIRRMAGLGRLLPLTSITFLLGCLALAGVPPLAGFFSKEPIIAAAFAPSGGAAITWPTWWPSITGLAALLAAGLTGFYALRLYIRVFHGRLVLPEHAGGRVHRPDAWMAGPMVLLAIGAVVAGWFAQPILDLLARAALESPRAHDQGAAGYLGQLAGHLLAGDWLSWSSLAVPLAGAVLAILLYGPWRSWTMRLPVEGSWFYQLAANAFYFDRLYQFAIVRPMRHLARLVVRFDDDGIDAVLAGATWLPRGLGWLARRGPRASVGGYAMTFAIGAILFMALLAAILWMR